MQINCGTGKTVECLFDLRRCTVAPCDTWNVSHSFCSHSPPPRWAHARCTLSRIDEYRKLIERIRFTERITVGHGRHERRGRRDETSIANLFSAFANTVICCASVGLCAHSGAGSSHAFGNVTECDETQLVQLQHRKL